MELKSTPLYVSKIDTAKAFCVSPKTVERWIEHGCPHYTPEASEIRKSIHLNLEDVRTWLTPQQKGNTSTFEKYVDRKKMQKHFKVSDLTIARWLIEGCPCIRVREDGSVSPRFRISEIETWLDLQEASRVLTMS